MRLKYLPAQVLQVQVTHLFSELLWLHCTMAHYYAPAHAHTRGLLSGSPTWWAFLRWGILIAREFGNCPNGGCGGGVSLKYLNH